jgi:molybdopterin-containing oxidoreductase family iron-sulfur binding subunit
MSVESKANEPEFWQSIDQWMESAKFESMMKDEFPEDASEWLDPVSRRRFLSLAGASVALAGAVGCNPSFKPASQKKIVPYVQQPDQIIPGVPLFFATAMPQQGGVGIGLLVKSHEGRPIKCEGNPNHPSSLGGIEHQALAAPLTMYDPDRSKSVLQGANSTTFDAALVAIKGELSKRADKQGAGVRFLTEPSTSPTFTALMDEVAKRYPAAKWIQYEPVGKDNVTKSTLAAFGKPLQPVYDLSKADVVLSLDADVLSGPGSVRYARVFGARRKVSTVDATHHLEHHSGSGKHEHPSDDKIAKEATGDLNRLYVVEGALTVTGASADHRLPLKPSQVEAFARTLAAELKVPGAAASADLPELARKWIAPLAKDLLDHKGHAVVIPGECQSAAVHLLAHAINAVLDAKGGGTVKYIAPLQAKPGDRLAELKTLVDEMKAGQVDVLVMSGVNPVYDAPADLDFAKALDVVKSKKGVVVHHGLYVDESAHEKFVNFHIPAAHFLEAWGDVRGHDGTVSIQQPLIAPLYSGKSGLELVAHLIDHSSTDGLSLVQSTTRKFFEDKVKSGKFEDYWQKSLRDGVLAGSASPAETVAAAVSLDKLNDKDFTQAPIKGLEIQFRPDPVLFDGKQANNGWLQELPKPITNLTWDNAVLVSPRTAAALKVDQAFAWTGGERGSTETDLVELTVNGRKLTAAVHIVPAMADDVAVFHLGFGRERGGRIAGLYAEAPNHIPGFNSYKLRGTDAVWTAPLELVRVPGKFTLAVAGAYAAMESRRPVRHATKDEFAADLVFAQVPASSAAEFHEIRSLTPGTPENYKLLGVKSRYDHDHGHEHKPHDERLKKLSLYLVNPITVNGQEATKSYRRWGMTIDLGSCIGCGACTLACVAENNTPVVGKDQVTRGRAMHWIRIDRYFSIPGKKVMDDELGAFEVKPAQRKEKIKESAAIRTHFQPVPCQHCEKAPCEVVCPVGATVHSADGLNDMAYNRCVGTRYCANNCPYKVRRFNFLQYTDYTTDSLKLLNNPEVSVRTRGVMEKCTYCTQRIRNAEIEAEREWDKKLPDGKPARPKDANGRPKILDGEVVTACQQACPTAAITFGDLNDPDSKVLKTKAEVHNYGLLAEYNTMPRTSYLAAIRNPNPNMPQGA